mmetsp:Transcript_43948/g.106025  ORF Transcript_43948/g.106025 Transcript_43948/m.106025 type:complete len:336 (+) Transcript_43948:584-1591(+)
MAAEAAEACELSDEIAENRMMVDGLLTNLISVGGFDPKSVADKKKEGIRAAHAVGKKPEEEHGFGSEEEQDDDSEEEQDDSSEDEQDNSIEEVELVFFKVMLLSERINSGLVDEEEKKMLEEFAKSMMDKIKPMSQRKERHEVFIRITEVSTGEVISQGFCNKSQRQAWIRGLELKQDDCPTLFQQGLEITLDFESFFQTKEMNEFLKRYKHVLGGCSRHCLYHEFCDFKIPFTITAMVVDKKHRSVQCLFQQDKSKEMDLRRIFPSPRSEEGRLKHEFAVYSTWGSDTVQLGPSSCTDRYKLSYTLSLHPSSPPYGINVIPVLDINIELDDDSE